MPEMAHPGEDHREASLIRCSDHLGVAHRSARLDHRRRARFGGGQQAIGEREERVGGNRAAIGARGGPAEFRGGFGSLQRGDPA